MNLICVSVYAEGSYSHTTHEENVWILTETFEKLESSIFGMNMYFHELDGKHSEVKGTVSIEEYSEEELLCMDLDGLAQDGERLEESLKEVFEENDLDYVAEQEIINKYLTSLDGMVEVTFAVRKSQMKAIQNLMEDIVPFVDEYVAMKQNACRDECHDCEYKYKKS